MRKLNRFQLTTLLTLTFAEMPLIFTSTQFSKKAVFNGFPQSTMSLYSVSRFLNNVAQNEGFRSKIWTKKSVSSTPNQLQLEPKIVTEEGLNFMTVEGVIDFLKRRGYKIMKPTTEWLEC